MVEEKPTVKERLSQLVQKAKDYPKILVSLLALFCIGIGFAAGKATSHWDQQHISFGDKGQYERVEHKRPTFKGDRRSNSNQVQTEENSESTSESSNSESTQESSSQ